MQQCQSRRPTGKPKACKQNHRIRYTEVSVWEWTGYKVRGHTNRLKGLNGWGQIVCTMESRSRCTNIAPKATKRSSPQNLDRTTSTTAQMGGKLDIKRRSKAFLVPVPMKTLKVSVCQEGHLGENQNSHLKGKLFFSSFTEKQLIHIVI